MADQTNSPAPLRHIPKEACAKLLRLMASEHHVNDLRQMAKQCHLGYHTLYKFVRQEEPRGLIPSTAFRIARHWPSEAVRREAEALLRDFAPSLLTDEARRAHVFAAMTPKLAGYSDFWLEPTLLKQDVSEILIAWTADMLWAHHLGRCFEKLAVDILASADAPQVDAALATPIVEAWLEKLNYLPPNEGLDLEDWSESEVDAIGPLPFPLLWNAPWDTQNEHEETTIVGGETWVQDLPANLPEIARCALAVSRRVVSGEFTHPLVQLPPIIDECLMSPGKLSLNIGNRDVATVKSAAHSLSISRALTISCAKLLYRPDISAASVSAALSEVWRHLLVLEQDRWQQRKDLLVNSLEAMEAGPCRAHADGVANEVRWHLGDDSDREEILSQTV